jgi:hypothetical protein
MRDYLTIGATPAGESCAQVGNGDYDEASKKECNAFKGMLEAKFVNCPDKARFVVKTFPHDFGAYREVCVVFDDEDADSTDYAYFVENHTPEYWDDIMPLDWKA